MTDNEVHNSDAGHSPSLTPQLPIDRLLKPLLAFTAHKLAGAGLLILATLIALVWANSGWHDAYHHLLEAQLTLGFEGASLSKSLHHWINDGLMGIFFFLVGLEIKRELLVGELSNVRSATLPAVAAIGGMVVPALLYVAINAEGEGASGWGIPMATDIAFALGVLALLGDRVPLGLKVFLTALAIVDDIGAVMVIALFYTADVSLIALAFGAACLVVAVVLNLLGTRNPAAYLVVGILAWVGFLESGVHATIAALLMAFTIPARTRIDGQAFMKRMHRFMHQLETIGLSSDTRMNSNVEQHVFDDMNQLIDHASAPLQRIEHALTGPVTFVVLPVFALANAGVALGGDLSSAFGSPIVLGIVLGLVVGKTLGITLAAWLAVRLRIADLPRFVTWPQVVGVAMLGGIGFTMALFVASLAFEDGSLMEASKLGIMAGSLVSSIGGLGLVWWGTRRDAAPTE